MIFSSLITFGQRLGFDVTDVENYQVWNMGVFISLVAPKEEEETIIEIAEKHGIEIVKLGYVQKGERSVVLRPKKIIYKH
jgi:phosphoribosylaminoimidazole (AIR) synthetase